MAKLEAKKLAYSYYINEGLNVKSTALKVDVSEKTLRKWINDENWDKLRIAKNSGPDKLLNSYYDLLQKLVEKRLEAEQTNQVDKSTIDEISKINKAIETLKQKDKPTLRMHIFCVEDFFNQLLKQFDYSINKEELIDFTKSYITKLAK